MPLPPPGPALWAAAAVGRRLDGHRHQEETRIETRGLTKRYGAVLAVDDLSFTVEPGGVTGFLGPSGSGKSTTMRMILGLDTPTSGTALICVTGILLLLATFINTADPVLILLGVLGGQSVLAGLLHLLLAFPSGRLSGPLDRVLVVAGYLTTVLPLLVEVGYSGGSAVLTALVGPPRPDVVAAADTAHRVLATAVLLLAAAVLVFIPFSSLVLAPAVGMPGQTRYLLQLAALAVVPFVVAVTILRGGFARTARIEELGMWLGADEQVRPPVRDALASALGDASLALYFPARSGDGMIDAAGRIVGAGRGGAASTVSVDGPDGTLAVIAYDATLIADAALVQQAGRVVALALERERLTAELLARRRELVESRSRLVEVADGERRRFAHNLHDLLQGRMVLAALHAGTLAASPDLDARTRENAEALRLELTEAISNVRRLVHGVMPALLVERGLFAAAEDLLGPPADPGGGLLGRPPGRAAPIGLHRRLLHPGRNVRERRQALRRRRAPGPCGADRDGARGGLRRRRRLWCPTRRRRAAGDAGPGRRPRRDVRAGQPRRRRDPAVGAAAVRVVIGEDETLLREGLALVLGQAGMDVVGAAADAVSLLAITERERPDVVLTDIRMPPGHVDDGLQAAIRIREILPGTGVLVLSHFVQRRYALELVGSDPAGVGYLLKERISDVHRFTEDVRQVGSGGTVLDPEVVRP